MDQASRRRGRPLPDAINMKPFAFNLEEALAIENTNRPNLLVIQHDTKPWEVTLQARDGAVDILRLLHLWLDVPSSIFFSSVTYLDLFLSRMKVQQRYLNCATISCFYIAALQEDYKVDVNQLLSVSQSKCSQRDMLRMAGIIQEKLKLSPRKNGQITTCADFLIIFLEILEYINTHWESKIILRDILKRDQLLARLKVLLADSNCAFARSSTLSLVLIKLELEKLMAQGIASKSVYMVGELLHLLALLRELQFTCKIKTAELVNCSSNATKVLKRYDSGTKSKQCQHLAWHFSSSTVSKSNRLGQFQLPLDTIDENPKTVPVTKHQKFSPKRNY